MTDQTPQAPAAPARRPRRRLLILSNVSPRFWLWRHRNHAHADLTGPVWSCSCGSTQARGYSPVLGDTRG